MLSADHDVVSSNPNYLQVKLFFHCFGDHAGRSTKSTRQKKKVAAPNDLFLELAFPAELIDT